jgi:hypothetical protein
VRVELLDRRRLTGTLGSVSPTAIVLRDSDGAGASVQLADVARLWRRGRATRTGALVGGALGAGFGLFIGAVAVGVCEYDCPSSTGSAMAAGAVSFGLLGTVPGALIGAAFPRWRTAWSSSDSRRGSGRSGAAVEVLAMPDSAALRPGRVGEFTRLWTAGYVAARATPGRDASAGPGGGMTLGLGLRRGRLAFGPETGVHLGAGGQAWSISGTSRLDVARSARGRASYLVLGAGANVWFGREAIFTGIVGVGQTRGGSWRAEARWNPVLQYADPYRSDPTFVTLGIGRVLAW